MNKKFVMWIAAILLITICLSLTACGKKPVANPNPGTTNQPLDTTNPGDTGGDSTQGTEATQGATESQGGVSTGSGRPDIESDTDVGSGRGEGSSSSQQQTSPPVTNPTETVPDQGLTLNYQQYMALSNTAQQELYNQYFSDDPLAFAAWFQKIKAEYEDGKVEIEATGPVDLEDYIKP